MLNIKFRKLEHVDLQEPNKILRLAFDNFVGTEEPMSLFGDSAFVRTRFVTTADLSFAIKVDGKLTVSVLVTY